VRRLPYEIIYFTRSWGVGASNSRTYVYASHISQTYAASVEVNGYLTELLQARLDANAYSGPVCLLMALIFLTMKSRCQSSWLLTALLAC
jgi:hypothetical protein